MDIQIFNKFPFKVRFYYKIEDGISDDQIEDVLGTAQKALYKKGINDISKKKNYLAFKHSFFSYELNWHLMAFVDGGYFSFQKDQNKITRIEYGITLITFWILSVVFLIIVFVTSREFHGIFLGVLFLMLLSWAIIVLRQWLFFKSICKLFSQKNILSQI